MINDLNNKISQKLNYYQLFDFFLFIHSHLIIIQPKYIYFDQSIVIIFSFKMMSGTQEKNSICNIYTDASIYSESNTGIGVFFGDGDHRNISRKIDGRMYCDIQRAELAAIVTALTQANIKPYKHIYIFSDNKRSVDTINGIIHMTAEYEDISKIRYADLLKKVLKLTNLLVKRKAKVEFKWVKSHSIYYGNNEADRLAKLGALSSYIK